MLVFVLCLVRGVALEALGLAVCVALHLAREILGVLLRALGGVLRVAAGTLGCTLRLFGLPLFARDLRLRLAAQPLLKLALVAQLLLGGMLLVPLLMRGGVLLMPLLMRGGVLLVPLEQVGLMLGAALAKNGVPFEMHIFPHGQHGLGLAPEMPDVAQWAGLCQRWLRGLGYAE